MGGLYSETITRRLSTRIERFAGRHRLGPAVLTVINLGVGCLVSFAVVAAAEPIAEGAVWGWAIGLLALAGWQFAYAVERAAGPPTRLSALCDAAVQISLASALAATAKAQVPETPAWLLTAFAGTWMVNLIVPDVPLRVLRVIRDYGLVVLLAGLVLTVIPAWAVWYVAVFTLVNAGFLAAAMVLAARAELAGEKSPHP